MAGFKRDVDQLIRQLRQPRFGCAVARTKGGHWKISKPGCGHVILSATPSDPRVIRNMKADLKRYLAIAL